MYCGCIRDAERHGIVCGEIEKLDDKECIDADSGEVVARPSPPKTATVEERIAAVEARIALFESREIERA